MNQDVLLFGIENSKAELRRVDRILVDPFIERIADVHVWHGRRDVASLDVDLVAVDVEKAYQERAEVVKAFVDVNFRYLQLVLHALEECHNHQYQGVRTQAFLYKPQTTPLSLFSDSLLSLVLRKNLFKT